MFIDVSAQGEKIVNGFRRPQQRHTPRGDRRSFRVSQEATHSLTRACAIPLPRSSEASARDAGDLPLVGVEVGGNRFGGEKRSAATSALGELLKSLFC